jgi:hypothetical protein
VDADRSRTNVRVVPDLGNELLIVIDRLEALLGSVGVWEIGTTSGYPAPSPTGEDAPKARAEVGDGSQAVLAPALAWPGVVSWTTRDRWRRGRAPWWQRHLPHASQLAHSAAASMPGLRQYDPDRVRSACLSRVPVARSCHRAR